MAYREDVDLEFLSKCRNEDLDILVSYITHGPKGGERLTEELLATEKYKRYHPDHRKYWQEIAAEIQCFGANTFITIFRGGKGVLYREVLADVCDKLKVNYNKSSSIKTIEMNLLMKMLQDSMEHMTQEELRDVVASMGVKATNLTAEAVVAAVQASVKLGGFAAYQVTVIVANAVARTLLGRGLSLAANAALTRSVAIFAGPIGWVITAVWTALDLAGPAYRVTIPCCIQVAFMRASLEMKQPADEAKKKGASWACFFCGCLNPGDESDCGECGKSRSIRATPNPRQSADKTKSTPARRDARLWKCPSCGHHNSSSRSYCEDCRELRPAAPSKTRKPTGKKTKMTPRITDTKKRSSKEAGTLRRVKPKAGPQGPRKPTGGSRKKSS